MEAILADIHKAQSLCESADSATSAGTTRVQVSDKTIAVLLFENLRAKKEDGFFADGIRDDVLTSQGKIKEPTASRALWSWFIATQA